MNESKTESKKSESPSDRHSFFWRIATSLKVPSVERHSFRTVKRSWTMIAEHNKLVMDTPNEENIQRRDIHETDVHNDHEVFNIKGPMGKGLCIEESGVHVAFCGGTGVLVFLDLVSHLILRAYYKHRGGNMPQHMQQLKNDFKFVFFVTMPCMDSEIGLGICEALQKVNRQLGEKNFELTVRISKRWDDKESAAWD